MKRIIDSFWLKNTLTGLLILALLLGIRTYWYSFYETPEHPKAVQGVLDLRGWDFRQSKSITLSGDWEFYPEALLTLADIERRAAGSSRFVQVPGDWRGALSDSPFGYGTYRLRVQVSPPSEQRLMFWFQRPEAASEVEINGKNITPFGRPADNERDYVPNSTSYIADIVAEGEQTIELIVRMANFDNPLRGGLVKEVRFGSDAAIDTERWYSIGFQLVTFLVLLLHGLYAVILFLFNPRQKTFLIFFLLMITAAVTVVSEHDKLLLLWIPMNYTWDLKIRIFSYMWVSYFVLLLVRNFTGYRGGARWFYALTALLCAYTLFILLSPTTLVYYSREAKVFSFFYLVPLLWAFCLVGKMVVKQREDAVFLLFAGMGVMSSVFWGILTFRKSYSTLYYPVDVIAGIVGFSAYWFKRYFRNSAENAMLNEQLIRSVKSKDQFLANTSHELRTPLHAIMNIAQSVVAKEERAISKPSAEDMELLITIGRRMSHLIDDLFDAARLREKRIVLRQGPVRVQSVASGVVGMLRFMTGGKPVRMKVEIDEKLPPLWADEKRLVQILFNLVHNALKFTTEGDITIAAREKDGRAVIEVADTGPGMDAETQSRVFLAYEQGEAGVSDSGGIGLGLSICQQLIELHGSSLTVRSEPGRGSVFRFSLPFAEMSAHEPAWLANAPAPPAGGRETGQEAEVSAAEQPLPAAPTDGWAGLQSSPSPIGSGIIRILAVDDDPVNLKVLAGILSTEPYRVRTVASAREALELLGTETWDVVVADVMMPHMSGYELTRSIRERFSISELPVLLLTARSQPADIYAGFMSGANDYVTKPVDALELKYRIWSLAALKQSIHERLRIEAAYLQAQIQPHFLFNTFNSIMALSEIDTPKMHRLAEAFTSYLRISFDFLNAAKRVALRHELELVEAYLYIEQQRFEERLVVIWEIEPGVRTMLPPLVIQPLVENAVKHGLLSRSHGGTLRIRIVRQSGSTLVEVEDNGKGMEAEEIERILQPAVRGKGGIGLFNTNRRLVQMYGQGLSIRSQPGEGTVVSFVVPD